MPKIISLSGSQGKLFQSDKTCFSCNSIHSTTGKIASAGQEANASRHNGGQIKGSPWIPRYRSAVMFMGTLNWVPHDAERRQSQGKLYSPLCKSFYLSNLKKKKFIDNLRRNLAEICQWYIYEIYRDIILNFWLYLDNPVNKLII